MHPVSCHAGRNVVEPGYKKGATGASGKRETACPSEKRDGKALIKPKRH